MSEYDAILDEMVQYFRNRMESAIFQAEMLRTWGMLEDGYHIPGVVKPNRDMLAKRMRKQRKAYRLARKLREEF